MLPRARESPSTSSVVRSARRGSMACGRPPTPSVVCRWRHRRGPSRSRPSGASHGDGRRSAGSGARRRRCPSSSLKAADQKITLVLMRGGSGVALPDAVGVENSHGTLVFAATYRLAGLPLTEPRAGDYRLVATWIVPDGSGRVLQASVPIGLTAS